MSIHKAMVGDGTQVVHQINEIGRRRKAKGSRNRKKARLKVARAHARVADRTAGVPPPAPTRLIRDNQALGVQDLAVKGARPHTHGQVGARDAD
ncbi:hypothetical protein [Streptomyces sp. NPDC013457]|uniref:hypothetical protein n=1 Tax=Streptomyces sp. NPDC013457 TaxID=3364866 RepID=UPI0037022FD6